MCVRFSFRAGYARPPGRCAREVRAPARRPPEGVASEVGGPEVGGPEVRGLGDVGVLEGGPGRNQFERGPGDSGWSFPQMLRKTPPDHPGQRQYGSCRQFRAVPGAGAGTLDTPTLMSQNVAERFVDVTIRFY